jgi:DNA primase large subunit
VSLEAPASAQGRAGSVSLAQLPTLAGRYFPLCMQQLYGALQAERHLKHAGRMQLGLFLKRAGAPAPAHRPC